MSGISAIATKNTAVMQAAEKDRLSAPLKDIKPEEKAPEDTKEGLMHPEGKGIFVDIGL